MNAYFYKFAKKINSTKRPSSSDTYTTKQVVLKEDTTLMNPIFRLTGVDWEWSLAYWNGYYYFIDDIIARNNNIYEVQCTMDVLGSYRGEIGSMTTFIERSASHYDSMVNDELLSSTQDIISKTSATTNTSFNSYGCYQILVSSKLGTRPYIFQDLSSASAFYNATSFTTNSGKGGTIENIVKGVDDFFTTGTLQALNLPDYCTPIMWLPISYSAVAESVGSIGIGYWTTNLSGYAINSATAYNITGALNLPSNSYSDFRRANPNFTKYSIFLPGVGLLDLNPLDAVEGDLYFDLMLDCFTGAVCYRIYHSSGADVLTANGQIGVPIPCGTSSFDLGSLLTNTIGGVVSATTGNAGGFFGSAVAVANGILSPQTCVSGGAGNKTIIQERPNIIVSCENLGSKSFPTNQAGRPYYTNNQISNLSGFVKCGNASFDSACLEPIKEQINNYLNSGFYYE